MLPVSPEVVAAVLPGEDGVDVADGELGPGLHRLGRHHCGHCAAAPRRTPSLPWILLPSNTMVQFGLQEWSSRLASRYRPMPKGSLGTGLYSEFEIVSKNLIRQNLVYLFFTSHSFVFFVNEKVGSVKEIFG